MKLALLSLLLVTFGGAVVIGCTPVAEFTPANGVTPLVSNGDSGSVEILTIPPGQPYQERGSITVNFASGEDYDNMLRGEAAKRGCDAVVLRPRTNSAACIAYTTR